jgi:hypothetical protein
VYVHVTNCRQLKVSRLLVSHTVLTELRVSLSVPLYTYLAYCDGVNGHRYRPERINSS